MVWTGGDDVAEFKGRVADVAMSDLVGEVGRVKQRQRQSRAEQRRQSREQRGVVINDDVDKSRIRWRLGP